MEWITVRLTKYKNYEFIGNKAYAKGKRLTRKPTEKTLEEFKKRGVTEIIWGNGDKMVLKDEI